MLMGRCCHWGAAVVNDPDTIPKAETHGRGRGYVGKVGDVVELTPDLASAWRTAVGTGDVGYSVVTGSDPLDRWELGRTLEHCVLGGRRDHGLLEQIRPHGIEEGIHEQWKL